MITNQIWKIVKTHFVAVVVTTGTTAGPPSAGAIGAVAGTAVVVLCCAVTTGSCVRDSATVGRFALWNRPGA